LCRGSSPLKAEAPEGHARSSFLSNFILGCQDGLVNVLGILLGLTAATSDVRLIFVGGSRRSSATRGTGATTLPS